MSSVGRQLEMKAVFNICLYDKAWVGVKAITDRNGKDVTAIVWTRRREEAAPFSTESYARGFIAENRLLNAKVKGNQA